MLVISAWKCAWYPNIPFDTIVGPDLVATFAVREQTLISSVFTEHLQTVSVFSNQPFYAPFTALQQIIYLLASGELVPLPSEKSGFPCWSSLLASFCMPNSVHEFTHFWRVY
ncbi:hypothetical protein GO730_02870 [Spirosoma sp. HMF3257]|uniref:hypothetical protein n=1 Tax=Spirosoma telluris TaxID=2183553 RepID=UPI0011B9426C|nr:hypothetical protein [Spirosoma telluris]